MEDRCSTCGGTLHQVAVLSNYKSFVISLVRCEDCGATAQRKENAHRPAEHRPAGTGRRVEHEPTWRLARRPRPDPTPESAQAAQPVPDPGPRPAAKRIDRPFNVRVTRRDP
jgi:hypothetical protein